MSLKPTPKRGRILFYGSGVSSKTKILGRIGLVVSLILFVVAVFWLDRAGLRDHLDGHISFTDILYFAMVTVTTVGYGDIVPVSDSARLIDAFAVTPIRLFIWFIFLGTAYEFVIQKIIEDYRMNKLQKNLNDHVVLCGFGHSGFIAAQEIVAKGTPAEQIVAIDSREERVRLAADSGYIGLLGDTASEELLNKVCIQKAKAVVVSTGRDDTTILVILTLRSLSKDLKIIANIREAENLKLAKLSGADLIVSPPLMGGYMLASGVTTEHATPFLFDIGSMGGHFELIERRATDVEIGKTMAQVTSEVIVQVFSHEQKIPFNARGTYVIKPNDVLLIISPNEMGSAA